MKILFFIDNLNAGGKERRMTELVKALSFRKDVILQLVVMNKEIHYKEILNLDLNIHYLIRKRKKDFSVFSKLYDICKTFKPDILHCWDSMTAIYAIPICKILHIKLVNGLVVDSPARRNVFNKYWLRAKFTFPFSTLVIGNSLSGLNAYKVNDKKRVCIYNGFDFKRTENLIPPDIIRNELNINTKFIIGMVASFSKKKDYPTYFAAAELLLEKRNDITFVAIGNKTDSLESQQLIKAEHKDSFRLLGKKSGIESFINIMDICILSTFTEGISNSILEYMALKKPVIATIGGGTNEIVEDSKTGFLVQHSNPESIAENIEILLNNKILSEKMGFYGHQKVVKKFSLNGMINEYMTSYRRVLNNNLIKREKHNDNPIKVIQ
jgi:glycosyltransferase involved in cell wall biosynthesis